MHPVSDSGIVWHGGIGHLLSTTDDGIQCYRCGMAACGDAWQELIPDCAGPDGGGDHHYIGAYSADGAERIECAYGDAWSGRDGNESGGPCVRA